MKLTVYLLRDTVVNFADVIPAKYKAAGAYQQAPQLGNLGFPCEAWVLANKKKAPGWIGWLSGGFDMASLGLMNQSNSFVLLLKVSGRIFGVTFGYGFNAVDRSLVEPDFGLKVTLNEVNPDDLDTLDTRTVDRVTRQRKTHMNVGRPMEDFDISVDLDWIRAVSGKPLSTTLARRLAGADSLKITGDCSVKDLAAKCAALLTTYQKKTYQTRFSFIDWLRRIDPKDPVIAPLDAGLKALLVARDDQMVAVAYPEIPQDNVAEWKMYRGGTSARVEDLSLADVYAFLDANPSVPCEPDALHVIPVDANDDAAGHSHSLRDYLVAQVVVAGETYILSLGQWFRADPVWVKGVRDDVRALTTASAATAARLGLPKWMKKQKEKDYNDATGPAKGWLVLDRKPYKVAGKESPIEVCDLLTPDRDFIHVKGMKDSATLSHLFAQGSVSAESLKAVPTHAAAVVSAFDGYFGPGKYVASTAPQTVVYAIATDKAGDLADTMFFFSAVNLMLHVRRVRTLGFDVAVCKIERQK